jgi:hypothetical protein
MNSAKDWAENGTPYVLPSAPVAASHAVGVRSAPPASWSFPTSRTRPCLTSVPSCAVSLMTMSGRSFWAAACWSLVSKSSKSAVALAGVPVAAVNAAAMA